MCYKSNYLWKMIPNSSWIISELLTFLVGWIKAIIFQCVSRYTGNQSACRKNLNFTTSYWWCGSKDSFLLCLPVHIIEHPQKKDVPLLCFTQLISQVKLNRELSDKRLSQLHGQLWSVVPYKTHMELSLLLVQHQVISIQFNVSVIHCSVSIYALFLKA